ncbi:hypothetical protein [Bradyrhizobium liaoningense]|uniref:hypothetical protein n=1 Tax=Bradyrhizobium liaoningense TaxID=43992 RepID=UPI0028977747|nr:hypothetical protein [Bradyrhizobium liaoningense]
MAPQFLDPRAVDVVADSQCACLGEGDRDGQSDIAQTDDSNFPIYALQSRTCGGSFMDF